MRQRQQFNAMNLLHKHMLHTRQTCQLLAVGLNVHKLITNVVTQIHMAPRRLGRSALAAGHYAGDMWRCRPIGSNPSCWHVIHGQNHTGKLYNRMRFIV